MRKYENISSHFRLGRKSQSLISKSGENVTQYIPQEQYVAEQQNTARKYRNNMLWAFALTVLMFGALAAILEGIDEDADMSAVTLGSLLNYLAVQLVILMLIAMTCTVVYGRLFWKITRQ